MIPDLIDLPAGAIVLRDEGMRTEWTVEVAAFRLAAVPVTHELYGGVDGGPARDARPRTPVTEVSWLDAVWFRNLHSDEAGLAARYTAV